MKTGRADSILTNNKKAHTLAATISEENVVTKNNRDILTVLKKREARVEV